MPVKVVHAEGPFFTGAILKLRAGRGPSPGFDLLRAIAGPDDVSRSGAPDAGSFCLLGRSSSTPLRRGKSNRSLRTPSGCLIHRGGAGRPAAGGSLVPFTPSPRPLSPHPVAGARRLPSTSPEIDPWLGMEHRGRMSRVRCRRIIGAGSGPCLSVHATGDSAKGLELTAHGLRSPSLGRPISRTSAAIRCPPTRPARPSRS